MVHVATEVRARCKSVGGSLLCGMIHAPHWHVGPPIRSWQCPVRDTSRCTLHAAVCTEVLLCSTLCGVHTVQRLRPVCDCTVHGSMYGSSAPWSVCSFTLHWCSLCQSYGSTLVGGSAQHVLARSTGALHMQRGRSCL